MKQSLLVMQDSSLHASYNLLQPSILKSKLPLPTILYPLCYVYECIVLVWSMDTHITWSWESSQNHFCWFTRSSSGLSFWSSLIASCALTGMQCPRQKLCEFIVLTLQILNNWWRVEDTLALAKLHVCIALCLCSNLLLLVFISFLSENCLEQSQQST